MPGPAARHDRHTEPGTRWSRVALLMACGMGVALHAGKVPPALPQLGADLHLGIVAAAWVLSLFSVVGASAGFAVGRITDRLGAGRVATFGMTCTALASFIGSLAAGPAILLASRAAEGLGFLLTVVSIPTLLGHAAAPRDRHFVSALWGIYLPTGMALALVGAPALLHGAGWRVLWRTCAALVLALAVSLASSRVVTPVMATPPVAAARPTPPVRWERRGALLLAVIFGLYTLQYLAVMGFLPTILLAQGAGVQSAGTLTAVAVIANALGNLAAGVLIARGAAPRRLIAIACLAMGLCAGGIYAAALPAAVRFALTVAFSLCGGLLPASVFSLVPRVAGGPRSAGTVMGLAVQGSHAGQLAGPPLVAAVAQVAGGWQLTGLVLIPAAALALLASCFLPVSVPARGHPGPE